MKKDLIAKLDIFTAGKVSIKFGAGNPVFSSGTLTVHTVFGPIDFKILPSDTPFFLCLKDINSKGIYLDNTFNKMRQIKTNIKADVTRK